jgi:aryl-alcohol dehydrogenase-like predicted oxidoreductase
MSLPGRAKSEVTQAYLGTSAPWVRTLGSTGLSVSALGFGSYRLDQGDPEHEQALIQMLQGGKINLIDTACNYTQGQSEELIGRVFSEQVAEYGLDREAFVFVTKAGYLTDELLDEARQGTFPEDAISKLGSDHWHSFHPSVLDRAIERSLKRLRLDCVDVFLLHNPEYFLSCRTETPTEELRAEFYDRVSEAFHCLEGWVKKGAIGAYGVSSNTLGFPDSDASSTSIERLIEAAESIAPEGHHFRVVQCPLNLMETTALESLAKTTMGVLTNRPLNAIEDKTVYRLAQDFSIREAMDFRTRGRALRDAERVFTRTFSEQCDESDVHYLYFAKQLGQGLSTFPSRIALQDYAHYSHLPRVRELLDTLHDRFQAQEAFSAWRSSYWLALMSFIESALANLEQRDAQKLQSIIGELKHELPPGLSGASWAQQAWWFCASRPNVSSVLTGIRRPKYVEEAHDLAERLEQ